VQHQTLEPYLTLQDHPAPAPSYAAHLTTAATLSMALGRPTPGARGAQVARQAINQAAQQGGGA